MRFFHHHRHEAIRQHGRRGDRFEQGPFAGQSPFDAFQAHGHHPHEHHAHRGHPHEHRGDPRAHGHHFHPHAHDAEFGPRGPRHFGPDWHDERFEGGRGGRRRLFDAADLRLILLKLIADESRHGYDLIRAIEELSGGNYVPSPGVVYPALSVLQDLGHIQGAESEGSRKAFAITADGSAELTANADKVAALFARLAALAQMRGPTDNGPIRRAMENLRAALWQKLGNADIEKDTVHDVAAILDEAAQRIERL